MKDKVIYHVAGNFKSQRRPTGEPLSDPTCAGLTSTIHVAQGTEVFPIIKLDETITPTHVFVKRSRRTPSVTSSSF